MLYILLGLNVLLLLQGAFSLFEGFRFLAFVRSALNRKESVFASPVCVICPCKGIDTGLEENLSALLRQDYPDYQVIFAIARADDPARPVIERCICLSPKPERSKIIVASPAVGRGEKVNNLLGALAKVAADREVLVFTDSDARTGPTWLTDLVGPLDGEKIGEKIGAKVGATTGYRWYLPAAGGFWSKLLSAWNGSVATTLGDHGRNFAWGGSTAIKRDTFDNAGVAEAWAGAVSDDYVLTRGLQRAGFQIRFVPPCLLVTREDASLRSLLEFTTRQVIITRVYRPAAWWTGFISHALFVAGFFGELILGIYQIVLRLVGPASIPFGSHASHSAGMPALWITLGLIYLLGSLKGVLRIKAALSALPGYRRDILTCWWMFCLLWPLVSLLFLYNFVRSALTRRIVWRGVSYELRSASETVVIDSAVGASVATGSVPE